MAEILIVYYSRTGSVAQLARLVARGVEEVPGMQARLRSVPPVAAVTQSAQPPVPDDGAPYATLEDLRDCAGLILEQGYALANADVTVVCEKPRLAPHIDAMRRNLSTDLACPIGDVSVKATTSEKLGFTGRGEGIAAFAVVLLWRPREPRPVSPDNPELDTLVRRLELDPL